MKIVAEAFAHLHIFKFAHFLNSSPLFYNSSAQPIYNGMNLYF
jgi:hypothetical protein